MTENGLDHDGLDRNEPDRNWPDRNGPDPNWADQDEFGDHATERYIEAVLAAVEAVPPGRVTTYGEVAARVGAELGRGGPRQVGSVLARYGAAVPWWRVLRADGRPARGHEASALTRLGAEGVVLRNGRVELGGIRWCWAGPKPEASGLPASEPDQA